MSVKKLSHRFFSKALSVFNQARVNSLLLCSHALIKGDELSLTAIGRHLSGPAKTKHKIKRVDRLLGNTRLHHEFPSIYRAITRPLLQHLSHYLIAVDWSGCCRDDYQLLRASLLFQGRSLPILNLVVDKACYNNNDIHHQFLQQLYRILGADKPTYIVTDGGFKTPWFQLVKSFGWHFIGRVRGNVHGRLGEGDWVKIQTLYQGATTTPTHLGKGMLSKTQKTSCEVGFHLYKGKAKGRHKIRGRCKPMYAATEKRCKSLSNEPWLLVTSDNQLNSRTVVNLYAKRMQIEQNFRDDKNQRYGFGWRNSFTTDANRIGVLCLIACIASILLWFIGVEAERRQLQYQFQANTIRHRRILSYLTLAKSLIRQKPRQLTDAYMRRAVTTFAETYRVLSPI